MNPSEQDDVTDKPPESEMEAGSEGALNHQRALRTRVRTRSGTPGWGAGWRDHSTQGEEGNDTGQGRVLG